MAAKNLRDKRFANIYTNAIVIRLKNRKTIMIPQKDLSGFECWLMVHMLIIKDENKDNLIGWKHVRGCLYQKESFITNEVLIMMGVCAAKYGQFYFDQLTSSDTNQ